jgi:SAM-dependent methyltransferase
MLAARQKTYWWHRARRWMTLALLRRHGIRGGRWLDLGCGPGGNLELQTELGSTLTVGLDLSPIALDLARRAEPQAQLVRATANGHLPFADRSFDLVTIYNVLYHQWIEDDGKVIAEATRILKPGGGLLLTEPAFAALAREMDTIGMAERRYRTAAIVSMCRAAGLQVQYASYFTSFGTPLVLASKLARRLRGQNPASTSLAQDMRPLHRLLDAVLFGFAKGEAWLMRTGIRIPFGITLVCVARKE